MRGVSMRGAVFAVLWIASLPLTWIVSTHMHWVYSFADCRAVAWRATSDPGFIQTPNGFVPVPHWSVLIGAWPFCSCGNLGS